MIHVIILLGALILVICLAAIFEKSDEEIIITFLEEQGYDVDNLEMTKVDGEKRLYHASIAIDIGDNTLVEYWKIRDTYGRMYLRSYSIVPYPYGKWPELISVGLSFTQKEYELLEEIIDGEEVEKFLKERIMHSLYNDQ